MKDVTRITPLAARGSTDFRIATSARSGKSRWPTPLGTLVVPVDGTVALIDESGDGVEVRQVFTLEEAKAVIGGFAHAVSLAMAVQERLTAKGKGTTR